MVHALLAIITAVRRVWILELAGAGLVVAGAGIRWDWGIALLVGGVLLLLKGFDLQLGDGT